MIVILPILYIASTFILCGIYAASDFDSSFWMWFTVFCPVVNTIVLLIIVVKLLFSISIKQTFKDFIEQFKKI